MLASEESGTGPRLVLVHGFSQTRRCWGPVGAALEADHQVVRVDAPGHGRSSSLVTGMTEGATLLAATGGTATYLGYSMGARLCLHLALGFPQLVRRLVVVGATAGIDDPSERARRVALDEGRAHRLERHGVERFLQEWMAQPLFSGLDEAARCLDARRENTASGLAASLRRAGTGAQETLWERLGGLAMPVLVVAGERDTRYVELGHRLIASVGDNATLALVPGAGHAAHLEAPDRFLAVLRPWLAAVGA